MKKILLSLSLIIMFVAYILYQRLGELDNARMVAPGSGIMSNQNGNGMGGVGKQMMGSYKDGTYTGSIADAYYGNVQVQATIQGGKITDVQFLDYPQDRQTSQEINAQAMPYLKTEAIQVQSANVDIISGATQTSRAFKESLLSALNQAQG